MIYLDNAATTPMHESVVARMQPYFTQNFGNPGSVHAAGRQALAAVMQSRASVAENLGCKPREVVFTSGGTEANNQAVFSAAAYGAQTGRKRMVASAIEHPAVLRALDRCEQLGFQVNLVAPDAAGVVSAAAVEEALGDASDVCLVSVMAANNETGVVQPVAKIAREAHAAGALFHTDAVQAAGHMPINVEALDADFLSISAHKFHGPKGVGALVCRVPKHVEPLVVGGGQERGLRAGTENVAGIVGLAAALEQACATLPEDEARVQNLRDTLQAKLEEIPGAQVVGGQAARVAGILNMCFDELDHQTTLALLDQRGICVSAGSACSSGATGVSHVLSAMGVSDELAKTALRFSLSVDTALEDVEVAAAAMHEIARSLKR